MKTEELYRLMDILWEWLSEEQAQHGKTPLHKAISGAYLEISILVCK